MNGKRLRGRPIRKPGQSRNQSYDSNGPEGRVRGTASQVYEKYLALARDAQSAGDRIVAENFFQHAEHYFRIMSAAQGEPPRPQQGGGSQGGYMPGPQASGNSGNPGNATWQGAQGAQGVSSHSMEGAVLPEITLQPAPPSAVSQRPRKASPPRSERIASSDEESARESGPDSGQEPRRESARESAQEGGSEADGRGARSARTAAGDGEPATPRPTRRRRAAIHSARERQNAGSEPAGA